MPRPREPQLQVLAALLPVLTETASFWRAFHVGLIISAAALLTGHFFRLIEKCFPSKLLRLAWVLWMATLFQLSFYFSSLPSFWMASLVLLFDWNDINPNRLGVKPLPLELRLGLFMAGMAILGIFREVLGGALNAPVFQQASGTLLLLAVFAMFLQLLEKILRPERMGKSRA